MSIWRMPQIVSMTTCKSVFKLLTVLCADSATSTGGLLEGTEKVGADHKSVLEASDSEPNNNLPRGVLDNYCPVTVLSRTLKESVFVMVVPRTMLRLPTTMIVVVLQILLAGVGHRYAWHVRVPFRFFFFCMHVA